MFLLHVELKPKPDSRKSLEENYLESFRPAISAQTGFCEAKLLRPVEDQSKYLLIIGFDNRASQQQWVATDLHQDVWPRIEANCTGYSVAYYNSV